MLSKTLNKNILYSFTDEINQRGLKYLILLSQMVHTYCDIDKYKRRKPIPMKVLLLKAWNHKFYWSVTYQSNESVLKTSFATLAKLKDWLNLKVSALNLLQGQSERYIVHIKLSVGLILCSADLFYLDPLYNKMLG